MMFSYDYGASSVEDGVVLVRSEPADLVEAMGSGEESWRLMVWRGAFDAQAIRSAFSRPDWPLRLISAMRLGNDWPWRAEKGSYGPVDDQSEALEAVSASAGAFGPAHGNLLLTMRIREFDDRSSSLGGLDWWKARITRLEGDDEFPLSLLRQIVCVLEALNALGSKLFVEQIAIVLNKDGDAPLCSITPTLHTDVFADKWGASVSSLLEDGLNPHGGAVFLPTCVMSELDHLRPITMEKMSDELNDVPFLASATGDLFMYGGMVDEDGTPVRRLGMPHLSADELGKSARLAILMYHAGVSTDHETDD